MTRRLISVIVTTVALGATPVLSAAQTIDTRPPNLEFFWTGYSSGVILGQTFTASSASDLLLTSVNLYQIRVASGQPTTFTASLSEWNSGTATTAAQVWSSSGSSLSASYSDLAFAVNTSLTFGTTYMFSLLLDASDGNFFMGATPYAGGAFYHQNAATPDAAWSAQWSAYDIAFAADIVTPEPSSMILLGSGLLALAGVALRRRTPTV